MTDHRKVSSRSFKSSDYLISLFHLQAVKKPEKPTLRQCVGTLFMVATLPGEEEVAEEKKTCEAKIVAKGSETSRRMRQVQVSVPRAKL